MKLFVITVLTSLALCHCATNEEISAAEYIKNVTREMIKLKNLEHEAMWNCFTNTTDHNQRKKTEVSADVAQYVKQVAKDINKFSWQTFQSDDLKRQLRMLSKQGYAALPDQEYAELMQSLNSMQANFAKLRFCEYENKQNCNLTFFPEVEIITRKNRDPEKLKHYWVEFYDKMGTPARSDFEKYIDLSGKAANLSGFKSTAEMWLDEYEDSTMENQLDDILETIKPFYLQIHGYVRFRLNQYYGKDVVSETGPIPMHLLGNLFAEQWSNIADIVLPFPNSPQFDVSNEMVKQGYTPLRMFQMGDDFFSSMGLKKAPKEFWQKSILEKPADGRNIICQPASFDFYIKNDVRITQCTCVNQEHLLIVHHELGHIQYYQQYQDQPFSYRTGANPGFHEAVGDVLSLSVSTPKHLERVGLLKKFVRNDDARINKLFLTALEKIVLLPYIFSVEKYRWSLFRGEVDKALWNSFFWKLREDITGIEPPVVRSEKDFDAPTKFHVSAGTQFLPYFVSVIIQFQLYESACIKAGQYDPENPKLPLDNCDIYGSLAAGKAFAKMLRLGASKPWPDALEAFTGERNMSAKAIVNYFEPLRIWLEAENEKNNVTLGWTKSDQMRSYEKILTLGKRSL